MQKNENPFVLAGILFLITALVALALSAVNVLTKDTILLQSQKEQVEARKTVLPYAETFEEIPLPDKTTDRISQIFVGKKGGQTAGYCVHVSPVGFGGPIEMVVGIDTEDKVTKTTIISLSETPGLGTKALEPGFIDQFTGKQSPITLIKNGVPDDDEIVAISGATVTSQAVKDGVEDALSVVLLLQKGGATS